MSKRPHANASALSRRRLLAAAATLPAWPLARPSPARAAAVRFGPPRAFDFAWLRNLARETAATAFRPPDIRHPDRLEAIDYDTHQKIRFRAENALWADGAAAFPVRFFHLGRYFKAPVTVHVVDGGVAREIVYSRHLFDFDDGGLTAGLPDDLGFAGFRLMNPEDGETDWLVFLGAAYFRSAGALDQYGMSARGIAIDTAMPWPEEFPRFTRFWLARPAAGARTITVYALLDGPGLTGAYRFDCTRSAGVVMDVRAELFARRRIARLGVAPLTSMFWFGENNRHRATDWRPEVHDSDGLAIWTGGGERIWRPLNNPGRVITSSFTDRDPKGFGLLQRDRQFHNYEDDGVFYDRRPSVWVEPRGGWGRGAVQLVEIPTDDEIHDNIVAYWLPAEPVTAGSQWSFSYRLHWLGDEPYADDGIGRVRHTRLGRGGVPGQSRPDGARKFVIDFAGGPLRHLRRRAPVEPVISASRGRIDNAYALRVVGTERWRAFFDLHADGDQPVDLRCFLRAGGRTLTETWLYQYLPVAA